MASRTITFRFPEEVIEAIEARARATGSNRTAVLMEALAQAYGLPSPSPAPVSTTVLQQQLHTLEQQIVNLLERLNDSVREVNGGSAIAVKTAEPTQQESSAKTDPSHSLLTQLEHKARVLDQILAATPDIVFVLDRMGRFTYINPVGARVFGFEPSYFLGKTRQDVGFSESVWEPFATQREAVFRTGRPVSGEISIPTVNETRDYEYILSPIQGANGSIDAVVCTARDITERKRVETALRESEEEYRNLFELANDSIVIIDASTNAILNANRNAARRLGYTRRELMRLSMTDIDPFMAVNRNREAILADLQRSGSVSYEHILYRKDGTRMPVEISSRLIEYGDLLAIQSFIRDITERKKAEERLHLLESAIASANDAIVIAEAGSDAPLHSKIIHVNKSFRHLTGYRTEEVLDQPLQILHGPKTQPAQLEQLQTAMTQRQSARIELLHHRKDGSEFWVELTIAPISDANDQYTHWMWVLRDVTARKVAL